MTGPKWWLLWHGGFSYAAPTNNDAEPVASIEEAKRICDARESGWEGGYGFPCVEEWEAWLISGPDPLDGDIYPDRILRRGPRGGIRVERA